MKHLGTLIFSAMCLYSIPFLLIHGFKLSENGREMLTFFCTISLFIDAAAHGYSAYKEKPFPISFSLILVFLCSPLLLCLGRLSDASAALQMISLICFVIAQLILSVKIITREFI